jgi:dynein heavy chain, axonemal
VEETLESSIDSLLEKKIQMMDGLKMTVLGDKKIAIDERFYLYMTTRLANPKFLAEVFNKSTVINFSITFNGLKDQFLSDVCKKEKPEVEQQRDEIIVKVAANKKFLKKSQDKILRMLAESKGMVLDDVELITTLEQSKIKSKEVEKSLEENSIV